MHAFGSNTQAHLGSTSGRALDRCFIGVMLVFLPAAFGFAVKTAIRREYPLGTVVNLCGSSNTTGQPTNIRAALTAYYECAGALVVAALAVGLFFLYLRALQQARQAAARPPSAN